MITTLRWSLVAMLGGHGLLHLLGVAKGFGWAEVPQLTGPIGAAAGALWLLAAVLVLAAAAFLALGSPTWWWALALGAAAISQTAIATSWSDARAGTTANIVLAAAAGYGFLAHGPTSFRATYRERAARALAGVHPSASLLSEADLVDLPKPLAAYIRRSGALGRARVVSFRAVFAGRIRSGPDAAWMPFTGQQVNTYGPRPQRVFLMNATRAGLPVTVLHVFAEGTATMRVKLLSLFTVVNASGAEMDRGETVTVFNDLVAMAPGAIAGAPATWETLDPLRVRGTFTDGDQTISAVLVFNAEHDLVDFVSDDRSRASADGTTFTQQRWSTPFSAHRDIDGRRVFTSGEGMWHSPPPDGSFRYLEFNLGAINDNVGHAEATPPTPRSTAPAHR